MTDIMLIIAFGTSCCGLLAVQVYSRPGDPLYKIFMGMRDAFFKIWAQVWRLWPRRRTARPRYDERRVAALEGECRDSSLQVFIDWLDRELTAEEAWGWTERQAESIEIWRECKVCGPHAWRRGPDWIDQC